MTLAFLVYIRSRISIQRPVLNQMDYSFGSTFVENDRFLPGFALGFKARGLYWLIENVERDTGLFDPQIENFIGYYIPVMKISRTSNLILLTPPGTFGSISKPLVSPLGTSALV